MRGSTRIRAERYRHRALVLIPLDLLDISRVDHSTLSCLLSAWTHCRLYRRPALSLLSLCYRWLRPAGPREQVVAILPRSVKGELLALFILVPVLSTDIAAPCSEVLSATDASFSGQELPQRTYMQPSLNKIGALEAGVGAYSRIYFGWTVRLRATCGVDAIG